jgi:hypothetical protein
MSLDELAKFHTKIVTLVGKKPLALMNHLPIRQYICANEDVKPIDALKAAASIRSLDIELLSRINSIIQIYPLITQVQLATNIKKARDEIFEQLETAQTASEMNELLTSIRNNSAFVQHEGIIGGLDFARAMIEDGITSIYSADYNSTLISLCNGDTHTHTHRNHLKTAKKKNSPS